MMKRITIILSSLVIVGCAAVFTTAVSYKASIQESYSNSEDTSLPAPAPVPSAPAPSIEEERLVLRAQKIPASKTHESSKKVPTIEEATQQIVNQLFETSTGIIAKSEATIDDTILITLVIDPTSDASGLLKRLEDENPNQSVITNNTKISSLAFPVLIAPDFMVEPIVAAEQAITKDSASTWNWQLKPKAGGKFTVIVELYAIVYIGEERTKKKYKTLMQPITITVPPKPWYVTAWNWLDEKWEWVWSTVLIPIGLLVWRRFSKKKPSKRK